MSRAEDQLTKESLESVTTGSFALNVSNYRSLLLSYEKEVQSSPTDVKRSALIFKEVAMLQEIIAGQIREADAKSLGVPPEELQAIAAIYRRALGVMAINYASKYDFLFGVELDAYLAHVEQWAQAPELHRNFSANLKMARTAISQLFRAPEGASLIAPSLVGIINRLTNMWPQVLETMPYGIAPSPGGPPRPPPPVAPPSGGGDNGHMEHRLSKLEIAFEHLQKDVTEIKSDVKDLGRESKVDFAGVRADMQSDFRLSFGAIIAVALGLAGMMAKGFGWI